MQPGVATEAETRGGRERGPVVRLAAVNKYREFVFSLAGVVMRVVDVNRKPMIPGCLMEGMSVYELADVLPDCGLLNVWAAARVALVTGRRQAVRMAHPWSRQVFFGYAMPAGRKLVVVRLYDGPATPAAVAHEVAAV